MYICKDNLLSIDRIGNKKLTISELLNMTIKFLKDNFLQVLIFTLLIYLPIEFIRVVSNFGRSIEFVIVSVLSIVSQIGIALGVHTYCKGEKVQWKDMFRNGIKKWLKGIGAYFLIMVITLAGLLLFILPGIYIAVCFQFVLVIIALKNTDIIHSLKYSRKLTKGNWWRMFLMGVLFVFVIFIIKYIFSTILNSVPVVLAIISAVFDIMAMVPTIFFTFMFLNLDNLK